MENNITQKYKEMGQPRWKIKKHNNYKLNIHIL